jgi:hypothetical protein
MGTQAARVALWVPTPNPAAVGEAIIVSAVPAGTQAPITTQFLLASGGGGSATFATPAEIAAGTVALKAVDPSGLRGELVRIFGGVSADYTNATVVLDGGTF